MSKTRNGGAFLPPASSPGFSFDLAADGLADDVIDDVGRVKEYAAGLRTSGFSSTLA